MHFQTGFLKFYSRNFQITRSVKFRPNTKLLWIIGKFTYCDQTKFAAYPEDCPARLFNYFRCNNIRIIKNK